jgi:hypothetical protein
MVMTRYEKRILICATISEIVNVNARIAASDCDIVDIIYGVLLSTNTVGGIFKLR